MKPTCKPHAPKKPKAEKYVKLADVLAAYDRWFYGKSNARAFTEDLNKLTIYTATHFVQVS